MRIHPRVSHSRWSPALAAGIVLAAQVSLVGPGQAIELRSLGSALLAPLVDGAAVAALLWAARVLRPYSQRLALAWTVLGLAQLCTLAGDLTWLAFDGLLGGAPVPSPADFFYLLYYPVFLAGVLLIPAHEDTFFQWLKRGLDMLIGLLAAVLVVWNFVLGPIYQAGSESAGLMWINLAYPVGDLLLLMALLMILYRPVGMLRSIAASWQLWLLAGGTLVIIIFDLVFGAQSPLGQYRSGSPIAVGYTLGNVLFALAGAAQARAGKPAQGTGSEVEGGPASEPWWLPLLPYAWLGGAYWLLIARQAGDLPMTREELTGFAGVLIGLVVLRQLVVVWENRRLSHELCGALGQVRRQADRLEQANSEMQVEIQERRRAEERLSYDALHDALTGLPNRMLFLDRLGQAGRKKKRNPGYLYSVLFLDLDSFKVVNDSLGHVSGDALLMRTAQVLQSCVRATDTVARLGGDEFVVLLEDLSSLDDVLVTADRLQKELNLPVHLNGNRIFITVSIGIVQHVDEYDFPEDILRDADLAMYQAKARGKARYEIFHAGMRQNAITRMELESDLRRAIEAGEFVLHYQPILELPGQQLVGFEALVRWKHPGRGLVLPAEFIPVAEETGMIVPLGKWILHEACRQARVWQLRYSELPALKVSVNISARQLKQPDFVEMVAQTLAETQLPADWLALEVTESICLDNMEMVASTLNALQALGVETQIDDFGTGYSALSYLQRLPVRSIKIDRSFIQSISADDSSGDAVTPDIVRAIFSMVNDLGMKAVAEGIETEVQLAELNRLHCAYVQGFLLARPMESERLERWLVRGSVPRAELKTQN